jgi:hypothetical protein
MHRHRRGSGFTRRRLRDLSGGDAVVIIEVCLLLPLVQLAVRLAGLRRTARWVDGLIGRTKGVTPAILNACRIDRIAQVIRGTCGRWPIRATCVDQALVIVALLGRRYVPVVFCIGFRRGDSKVEGHAWVEHDGLPLAEIVDVAEMSRQEFLCARSHLG